LSGPLSGGVLREALIPLTGLRVLLTGEVLVGMFDDASIAL
jgi:hypothetical protein